MKQLHIISIMVILALSCQLGIATTNTPVPELTESPTQGAFSSPEAPLSLWYLTRGDIKSDQAWAVDVDNQGYIYYGSHQQKVGELFSDMVIYKITPDGSEVWQTRWGSKMHEKTFIIDVSEPYVFVGGLTYTSINIEEADFAILALDMATGQLIWDFTWGQGFGYEEVDGLVADGDFIYVSGWTTGETSSNDVAILKIDRQGNLIWVSTWGEEGYDTADGQMVVDDAAIYISGRNNGENYLFGGDALIAKFSKQNGEFLDYHTWGGAAFDDALGMTSDGKYLYAVGLTLSFGNGGQIFVLKLDKDLNVIWEQIWGGHAGESARTIAVDELGNIIVAGQTDSYGSGNNDVVLIKLAPDGNLNYYQVWGGEQMDSISGLVLHGNVVYLAGLTRTYSKGQDDALLIKANYQSGIFPPP